MAKSNSDSSASNASSSIVQLTDIEDDEGGGGGGGGGGEVHLDYSSEIHQGSSTKSVGTSPLQHHASATRMVNSDSPLSEIDETESTEYIHHRLSAQLSQVSELNSKVDVALLKTRDLKPPVSQVASEEEVTKDPSSDLHKVVMHDLHSPIVPNIAYLHQKNFVSVFEGLALSCILEEVYLQLEILGHSFPGQIVQPEDSDFLTYDERFTKEVEDKDLEYMPRLTNFKNPFLVDETQIGTPEELLASKLQKDRAFLQELLRLAKKELDESRTFESLKDNVTREDGRRHEEITLMEREHKAMVSVSKMRHKIAEFKAQMKRDEHKRLEMINHLKDQLHEAKQQGKQDARYTRAWYESRNAHNFSELSHRTEIAQLRIKALEIDMTRDKLAHQNIQAWYALVFDETTRKVEQWKQKFDEDLEIIDKKIREQQDVIRAQQTLMESLNNTIAERMVELGPWEEQKDAERNAKLEFLRIFHAARKIQRWWRVHMTVHNLYKKKKGKKGVKGGKSKGGKKKKKKRMMTA